MLTSVHNMMQVCRRQVYEGSSKAQMFGQSVKKVARSTDDMLALLFGLMLNLNTDWCSSIRAANAPACD